MPIPDLKDIKLPMLKLLSDGQSRHVSELRDQLADEFRITPQERQQLLPSGKQRLFDNRVAWARTDLGQAGAIESPQRGTVRITNRGHLILGENPDRVDRPYLKRFPEFEAFLRGSRGKGIRHTATNEQDVEPTDIAEEAIEQDEVEADAPTIDVPQPMATGTMSFLDAAEQVLLSQPVKLPMHYRAITEKALEMGLLRTQGQTPEATMYAQILTEFGRQTRQGKPTRFMKYGKGMVSLSAWSDVGLAAQIDDHNRAVRKQLLVRLSKTSPVQFEALVGQLLVALGFQEVTVTSRSGDGGIDVRGTLVVGDVIRTRMAVQVKRWKSNVQAPTVQQVRGSLGTHDQGLIITTSDFSTGARTEAERANAVPVALMNGAQLVTLLIEHNIGVRRQSYDLIELSEDNGE